MLPEATNRRRSRQLVGPGRLELPTSRLSGVRSNHLSYGPIFALTGAALREGAERSATRSRACKAFGFDPQTADRPLEGPAQPQGWFDIHRERETQAAVFRHHMRDRDAD